MKTEYNMVERGDRLNPSIFSRLHWHLTCLKRQTQRVCEKFLEEKNELRLIDFGCGNSPYRQIFEPYVEEYLGADLAGNEKADLTITECGKIQCGDHLADIVLSAQVLEHVFDPQIYLTECRRVLRKDGFLILSTHGTWKFHPDPNDFWRWTSQGLKKTIQDHGFEIKYFEGVMGPLATGIQIAQDAIYPAIPAFLRGIFCLPIQVALRLADWITSDETRRLDSCVYMMVVRKVD